MLTLSLQLPSDHYNPCCVHVMLMRGKTMRKELSQQNEAMERLGVILTFRYAKEKSVSRPRL